MVGATLVRRFPSAVRSDRVALAVKPSSQVTLRSAAASCPALWWSFTSSVSCLSVRSRHRHSSCRLADCSVGGFTAGPFGLRVASREEPRCRRDLSTTYRLAERKLSTDPVLSGVSVEKSDLLVGGASVRADHLNDG